MAHFFLKLGIILLGKLGYQNRWEPRGVPPSFFHFGKKLRFVNAQQAAEFKCVQWFYLPWDDHHIISRLIAHQQFTVPIVNVAAFGIVIYFFDGRIVQYLVRRKTEQLQIGKPTDKGKSYEHNNGG